MASPTAIPHAERSCHHRHGDQTAAPSLPAIDTSSQKSAAATHRVYSTSPPLVSPLYSGAGRAFAATGNSATSPNTRLPPAGPSSTWSLASGRVASSPRQEYFDPAWGSVPVTNPDGSRVSPPLPHHRRATSGSISSLSSAISVNEPPTPRAGTSPSHAPFTGGMALGRVPSLPLSTSYEQAQKRMSTGGTGLTTGWGGLAALRGKADPNAGSGGPAGGGGGGGTGGGGSGAGGMSGLLRKLSISSGPLKSPPQPQPASAAPLSSTSSTASAAAPASAPAHLDVPVTNSPPAEPKERGRRPSVGMAGKRRPSPMGERLLLGHFSAH